MLFLEKVSEKIIFNNYFLIILIFQGNNRPAFYAASVFFGISMPQEPKENFSRFLLLIFLWFCLIFRTCIQSKMFEFMITDMRKPLPSCVEDFEGMNYTIVVINGSSYKELNDELINGRAR